MKPKTDKSNRREFERWACSRGHTNFASDTEDSYADHRMQWMWEAWQGASLPMSEEQVKYFAQRSSKLLFSSATFKADSLCHWSANNGWGIGMKEHEVANLIAIALRAEPK